MSGRARGGRCGRGRRGVRAGNAGAATVPAQEHAQDWSMCNCAHGPDKYEYDAEDLVALGDAMADDVDAVDAERMLM